MLDPRLQDEKYRDAVTKLVNQAALFIQAVTNAILISTFGGMIYAVSQVFNHFLSH